MSTPMHHLAPALAVACLVAGSCFSPAEPVRTRWFSLPLARAEDAVVSPTGKSALRIERVTAAAHLGAPMVWRLSDVEVAIDEVNRWVDEPAALVERALDAALFGNGGFTPGDRDAAALRVHVDAFEAVLEQNAHVRVAVRLTLDAGGGPPVRSTVIELERPLPGAAPEDVARGLGGVLVDVAQQTATWCAEGGGG